MAILALFVSWRSNVVSPGNPATARYARIQTYGKQLCFREPMPVPPTPPHHGRTAGEIGPGGLLQRQILI